MPIGTPVGGTAATNAAASTTLSIPYPSGVTASDALVLIASTNSATLPTIPSGWTGVVGRGTGSQSPGLLLITKAATGSESGSFALTTPSSTSNGRIWKVSGVDLTNVLDVAGTLVAPSASTTLNIPSLTTTRAGALLFVAGASAGPSGTWTSPTSPATFTKDFETTVNIPATTGHYLIWAGSGATGTVVLTRSSSLRSVGAMIALRPLADATARPRNITASNPARVRASTW